MSDLSLTFSNAAFLHYETEIVNKAASLGKAIWRRVTDIWWPQVEMTAWVNKLKKMYANAWCVFVLILVWYFKT